MITKTFANGEKRAGCRAGNESPLRLGILRKLDMMPLSEFRLLPDSEQEKLLNRARLEKGQLRKLQEDDAGARDALSKRGIGVGTSICQRIKVGENTPDWIVRHYRRRYGPNMSDWDLKEYRKEYYPDLDFCRQISVTLEIPGSGKPLTLLGKRHIYNVERWSGAIVENLRMLDRDFMGLPDAGSQPPYKLVYNKTKDSFAHKHNLIGVMLTGLAINGKVVFGTLQKNAVLGFLRKLFKGNRHTLEVGCCAIAEKPGERIYLHHETLRVPTKAPAKA